MTQEDNTPIQPTEAPVQEAATQEAPPELIQITDLDSFARMVAAWHENRVARLRHMLDIPEGTEVEIGDTKLVLTGEIKDAFRLGLHVALHEMGQLPFVAEFESPEEAANAAIETAKTGELPDLESTLGLTG